MVKELSSLRAAGLAELCRLNNEFAVETSWLSEAGMEQVTGMAFYARGLVGSTGEVLDAMLIAFDEMAPYANRNFEFFKARHERFVYIDRLITASHARRRGLGRWLYEDLFEKARRAGQSIVGCEVNLDPPNPGSDAFHEGLGFVEVGRARLENGKTVRYLEYGLT